jgi:hypothetical protein
MSSGFTNPPPHPHCPPVLVFLSPESACCIGRGWSLGAGEEVVCTGGEKIEG